MAEGFITRRGGAGGVDVSDATATEDKVLQGETFYAGDEDIKTGTITSKSAQTFSPGTTNQTIAAGQYLEGTQTIIGDADLVPNNIRQSTTIFGVTGTLEPAPPAPVYTTATGGTQTTYTQNGKNYRAHTFTSSGTFTVNSVGDGDRNLVDYLIVAGGGAGGRGSAGGGGAGGYRTTDLMSGANTIPRAKVAVTAQSYTITVGGGGSPDGGNGSNSSALGVTTTGGGGGGNANNDSLGPGKNGGSGGGSGGGNLSTGAEYNAGNGTALEGRIGGRGVVIPDTSLAGGGGGGASGVGGMTTRANTGGNGGNGTPNTLRTGTAEIRGGGGGGGSNDNIFSVGGEGGGGRGGTSGNQTGNIAGTANTGGGGGGAGGGGAGGGKAGGSGIVIIRYEVA